jgi:KilA-N domain
MISGMPRIQRGLNTMPIKEAIMATTDFTSLLTVSQTDRPEHVPDDYIRVDHWGVSFGSPLFVNYERNIDTKKYHKAVGEKLYSNSHKAKKLVFKPGQKHKGTGIWVHPLIALHYGEWLSPEFAVVVKDTFRRVVEGDSDLAADMMIRDHNKDRVERALKRVRVTRSNKQLNEFSKQHNTPYHQIYDDRNLGLYGLTTQQLRDVGGVQKKETPQNFLSDLDLAYADVANLTVMAADNPSLMVNVASELSNIYRKTTGRILSPTWDAERLTPSKARAIVHSEQYQGELPLQ